MVSIYIYLTFSITEWRIKFRRDMNNADNSVSTKIVDSLLNYETVKYFNNDSHEFKKLDSDRDTIRFAFLSFFFGEM